MCRCVFVLGGKRKGVCCCGPFPSCSTKNLVFNRNQGLNAEPTNTPTEELGRKIIYCLKQNSNALPLDSEPRTLAARSHHILCCC